MDVDLSLMEEVDYGNIPQTQYDCQSLSNIEKIEENEEEEEEEEVEEEEEEVEQKVEVEHQQSPSACEV